MQQLGVVALALLLCSSCSAHTGPETASLSATPRFSAAEWKDRAPLVEDPQCSLCSLDARCPADRPQRFQNGDGVYSTQHTAYVGKNGIGTLPVPPGQAACCVAAGNLFVNPPPNGTIPAGCTGTGSMVFPAVQRYTLLRWWDFNPPPPPPPGANATRCGAGCEPASPFVCEQTCYCVPRAVCSVPGQPAVIC